MRLLRGRKQAAQPDNRRPRRPLYCGPSCGAPEGCRPRSMRREGQATAPAAEDRSHARAATTTWRQTNWGTTIRPRSVNGRRVIRVSDGDHREAVDCREVIRVARVEG